MRRTMIALALVLLVLPVGCGGGANPEGTVGRMDGDIDGESPSERPPSWDKVLDFFAALFADPDFVREMKPIRALVRSMQIRRMTAEQVERCNRQISNMWREKAEPVFRAHVRRACIDMDTIKAFLKSYIKATYDGQREIVAQISERMPEDKRPGACGTDVLSFLHSKLSTPSTP